MFFVPGVHGEDGVQGKFCHVDCINHSFGHTGKQRGQRVQGDQGVQEFHERPWSPKGTRIDLLL